MPTLFSLGNGKENVELQELKTFYDSLSGLEGLNLVARVRRGFATTTIQRGPPNNKRLWSTGMETHDIDKKTPRWK
jgi:hypothetical protein